MSYGQWTAKFLENIFDPFRDEITEEQGDPDDESTVHVRPEQHDEGKGEKVTPLPPLTSTSFVLLIPPLPKVEGKTKRMYGNLRVADFAEGQFVKAAVLSLKKGKRLEPDVMFNVFGRAAFDFFPRLDKYREILKEAGAPRVHVAGSGPCLFSIFAEAKEAGEVFSRLKRQGLECYLVFSFTGQ